MSPEKHGIFQLVKKLTLHRLCCSSTASFCDGFARYSSAFTGLGQASWSLIRVGRQPSCTTFSPIRWAKWRMLWVWSP